MFTNLGGENRIRNPVGSTNDYTGGFGSGVLPDGKILRSYSCEGECSRGVPFPRSSTHDQFIGLFRYYGDGNRDSTFGDDGLLQIPAIDKEITDLKIQSDGKILLMGRHLDLDEDNRLMNQDFYLLRLNRDASLDTDFGRDGSVITPVGSANTSRDYPTAIAVENGISSYQPGNPLFLPPPSCKAILAGHSSDADQWNYRIALVRYILNEGNGCPSSSDDSVYGPIYAPVLNPELLRRPEEFPGTNPNPPDPKTKNIVPAIQPEKSPGLFDKMKSFFFKKE